MNGWLNGWVSEWFRGRLKISICKKVLEISVYFTLTTIERNTEEEDVEDDYEDDNGDDDYDDDDWSIREIADLYLVTSREVFSMVDVWSSRRR